MLRLSREKLPPSMSGCASPPPHAERATSILGTGTARSHRLDQDLGQARPAIRAIELDNLDLVLTGIQSNRSGHDLGYPLLHLFSARYFARCFVVQDKHDASIRLSLLPAPAGSAVGSGHSE